MAAGNLTRSFGTALLAVLALSAGARAATTRVTLHEGTRLQVACSVAAERVAFELAGGIWTMPLAGGDAQRITPEPGVYRRPAWAPDGSSIAAETVVDGHTQIVLLDPTGSDAPRQVTFGDYHHREPAWAPDSRRIAIASNRGGSYDIWQLDIASLALTQLTFGGDEERAPAWHPDGKRLAFVMRGRAGSALYTLTPGQAPERLARGPGRISGTAWRPDGTVISYTYESARSSDLRIAIPSAPPVTKRLTRNERVFPGPAQWLDRDTFVYAADGRIRSRHFSGLRATEIPFTAAIEVRGNGFSPRGRDFDDVARHDVTGLNGLATAGPDRLVISALGNLYELDGDGRLMAQLSSDRAVEAHPAISSDNRRLAFVSDRGGSLQVHVTDLASGKTRQVTHEGGPVMYPVWVGSKDAEHIAYLAAHSPLEQVFDLKLIGPAGTDPRILARGLRKASAPTWHPEHGISLFAAFESDPASMPPQYYLLQAAANGSPDDLRRYLVPGPGGRQLTDPALSPEGDRLAFVADQQLMVGDLDASGAPVSIRRVGQGPAAFPRWMADGRTLLHAGTNGLTRTDVDTGASNPLAPALSWARAGGSGRIIIRAGRLYDGMEPRYKERQEIVIENNRIAAIRPWSATPDPDATLIDATGQTVLPGLIDLAAEQVPVSSERSGRAWLAFGVTSIRETVTQPFEALERQASWRSARRPGPRLFANRPVCAPGEAVDIAVAAFADAISSCPGTAPADELALIGRAHDAGLPAISHAPFPGLMLGANEVSLTDDLAGQRYSHRAYADVLDAAAAVGTSLVSRLGPGALAGVASRTPALTYRRYRALYPASVRKWYAMQLNRGYRDEGPAPDPRSAAQSLFLAAGRGARVVTGSAAPLTPPGLGLHIELQLLAGTGLQPFQVLKMATLDAARTLGVAADLGSIEPGRLADLIVVEGDPLVNIADTARVTLAVVDGRPYRLSELLQNGIAAP